MIFRTAEAWAERNVTLCLGRRVTHVNPNAHQVRTDDGALIGYGQLIWATGGRRRRLTCSGHDAKGVHTLRERADVDRMIAELPGVREVVVIAGGYIGLETAAGLVKAGKKVAMLEALERVLARVAGEPLSRFYEAEHRAQGVDVRLGAAVSGVSEEDARATGVILENGETVPCQMVIVGIGIVPAVEPLIEAGAAGGNGVRVDRQCRTSLLDIFAIGDCAEHRNPFAEDNWIRLESVQNTNDQAATVAKTIVGGGEVQGAAVPWFWFNQYDLRLQTVGLI